jgi:hypothetical protein
MRAGGGRWLGVLVLASVSMPWAAAAQTSHHPVNFSFFYPISTNRSPNVSTNFRLGIFYGRVAEVRGVDVTAFVARTDGDFRGVQLVGATAYTGGSFKGLALVGGVHYLGGAGRGIQLTGGVNFDRDRFRGGQVAGILNFVGGDFSGLQLTSFYNLCDADVRGVQLSTIANTAGGAVTGLQLAGINIAGDSLRGLQAGLCNFAPKVGGVQLAAVNFAGQVDGAQIGFWNQAKRVDGMMFGAVNLAAENGYKGWVTYASSYSAINTGLYSGVGGWYSMLTVGAGDVDDERSDTLFFSWHYGRHFELRSPWRIDADLGFVHVVPQPSDDASVNDRLHFAGQARVMVDRAVSDRWRVFAGGGLNAVWSEYSKQATADTGPLGVLGVILQ